MAASVRKNRKITITTSSDGERIQLELDIFHRRADGGGPVGQDVDFDGTQRAAMPVKSAANVLARDRLLQ